MSEAKTERSGIYWKPSLWALARSAYVADLDADPDCPDAFVAWLGRALVQHVARTPNERSAIAEDPQLHNATGQGVNRSHPLRVTTIEAVTEALILDRRELGRVVSRSGFAHEAVVAAAGAARERLGRPLPPPPARLSNRPPRRAHGQRPTSSPARQLAQQAAAAAAAGVIVFQRRAPSR